jgi:hypothetical protein
MATKRSTLWVAKNFTIPLGWPPDRWIESNWGSDCKILCSPSSSSILIRCDLPDPATHASAALRLNVLHRLRIFHPHPHSMILWNSASQPFLEGLLITRSPQANWFAEMLRRRQPGASRTFGTSFCLHIGTWADDALNENYSILASGLANELDDLSWIMVVAGSPPNPNESLLRWASFSGFRNFILRRSRWASGY